MDVLGHLRDPDELLAVLDRIGYGVFVLDRTWRIAYVNDLGVSTLRLSRDELVGSDVWELFPQIRGTSFHAAYERVMSERVAAHIDEFVPSFEGWFAADAYPGPGPDAITVVFRETTLAHRDRLAGGLRRGLEHALASSAGPIDALRVAASELRRRTGFDVAELWTRRASAPALQLAWEEHADDPRLKVFATASLETRLAEGSLPWDALEAGRAVVVDDLAGDPRWQRRELSVPAGLQSAIVLPMSLDGTPDGAITLLSRDAIQATDWPHIITTMHDEILALVARQRERNDFTQMFRVALDPMTIAGLDGWFLRVNPRFTQVLGHSEEALLAQPFLDFVHPDDREATRVALGRLNDGEAVDGFVNRYSTADGGWRLLSWTARALPSEGVTFAVARDVTDATRDSDLEQAQREVLQAVVTGEPLGAVLDRISLAIEQRFPGRLASVFRYDPQAQVLRRASAPSLPSEYLEAVGDLPVGPNTGSCGSAAHTGEIVVATDIATDPHWVGYRELAAAFDLVSCWCIPIHGQDRQLLGTVAIYGRDHAEPSATERVVAADLAHLAGIAIERDTTARRLAASEERFRLLGQATGEVIRDWDLDSDRIWWNEAFAREFGHDPVASGEGLDAWSRHIHPDDRAGVVADLHEALAGDASSWSAEYRFLRGDSSSVHVRDRAFIIRDADGSAHRMVGGMVDDTERHEREVQHQRAQRLESLGTLAGGIAHDLNNMLSPVMMAADLLGYTDLTDDQRDSVDTIASSARRGAELVGQVLTFARGADGEHGPVDMRKLGSDVERMLRDTLPKHLAIDVTIDDDLWAVMGDIVQLEQVVINLAVNARDAMPEGGVLRLSIANVGPSDLDGDEAAGGHVRISVSDTGSGIEEAIRERIFEPFFTTKPLGAGSGLGLATSLTIVERHGGRFELDTEPGRGSTFHVYLPRADDGWEVGR